MKKINNIFTALLFGSLLPAIAAPTDLTVYEIHVQDLTTDDTWTGTEENRGKFLGLIEEGTTYTAGELTVKTGFDHIVELGVNTVQIMPFYDQANDETNPDSYNWGYNPQNYNVVEGAYSSQPSNGAIRVNEFKQVVQKFASKGIRVVMDVVYNHMASMSSSSFNRLVPDYFFRRDAQGILKNESSVDYDFNFWQDVEDLSASAIAAAYLGDEAPIYVFVAGRLYGDDTPGTSSATKQNIAWELNPTKSVYTRVLFDSANVYPVGSEYLNDINLSSYQIVVLERIV